jgi:hypothetical protein
MAALLDLCNQVRPSPVWRSLLHLDYENDAREMAEWFGDLLRSEPPSANVNGLWFGLSNPILRGQPTSCLHLAGSTRFNPQQSPPEWASGPQYFPEGWSFFSRVLKTIYRAVKESRDDIGSQGEYTLCLGHSCLVVAEWCRGPMRAALLGDAPLRAVAVGFDSGDALLIDVLRRGDASAFAEVGHARQPVDEAGWLACSDPKAMLGVVRDKASARQLRLFAVACCRRIWHLLKDDRSRHAVGVAERLANGLSTEAEAEAAYSAAKSAMTYSGGDMMTAEEHAAMAAADVLCPAPAARVAASASASGLSAAACDPGLGWFDDGWETEPLAQAHLLRDIVGSPFGAVSFPSDR